MSTCKKTKSNPEKLCSCTKCVGRGPVDSNMFVVASDEEVLQAFDEIKDDMSDIIERR
jgi:hypothetical protein